MEELINFRLQIDLLNDKEFLTFMQSFKRDHLTTLLFAYFQYQLINTKHYQQWQQEVLPNIHTMMGQIQNIIDSRDKPIEDKQNKINLDDLPMVMISSISSFLDFKDTLKFEKTNRNIFIGTRSPISIKSLDDSSFISCISCGNVHSFVYHFYRFRYIQELSIDGDRMMFEFYDFDKHTEVYTKTYRCYITDIGFDKLPIWNRLTTLSLATNETWSKIPSVFHLLNRSICANITRLSLMPDNMEYYMDPRIDNALFPNLRYLHLQCDMDSDFMFDSSELKGLSLCREPGHCQQLIHKACSTLESFHLESVSLDVFSKQNKFLCLKELCISPKMGSQTHRFTHLYQRNFIHLQRYHCDLEGVDPQDEFLALMKVVLSVRSLDYIYVRCGYDMLLDVFQMIQAALKGQHKDSIKIRIDGYDCQNEIKTASGIYEANVVDLVNTLDRISKHFMFIGLGYINEITILTEKLNGHVINSDREGDTYYISNEKCNINGYYEKWIMSCEHCSDQVAYL